MGFLQAVGQASPAILSNIGQMKQMAIQDQQEKREAVKFDYLQKKMAEEEADSNKLIPVSMLANTQLGQYPTAMNLFLEQSRKEGALVKNELAGEEMMRKKDIKGMLSSMNLSNEFGQSMMKGIYQDAKMKYQTLLEQKNGGKLKKPEELEALKQAEAEYLGQASLMDEAFQKAQIERNTALYKETIKPPDVQKIQTGRNEVQYEWNPVTRTRTKVGGGPMDAPEKPEKPKNEWVFDPKTKVKRNVSSDLANELVNSQGWKRGQPTGGQGELSDSEVLRNIREIAQYDQVKTAKMWGEYNKLRRTGTDRGTALETVQNQGANEQEEVRLTELHKSFPDPQSIKKAYKDKTITPEDAQLLLEAFHEGEY